MNAHAPLLQCHGLQVGFGRDALLPPLDWTVRRGQIWALVGANGSGKTTLLRTLLAALPAVAGRHTLLPGVRAAYLGQLRPFGHDVPLRVIDLVRGGALRGWRALLARPWTAPSARLRALMQETGLTPLAQQRYAALSCGQKQRVALARALASAPDLLLLDEPTGAMDAAAATAALQLVQRRAAQGALGAIVVGHQLDALLAAASHICWLHAAPTGLPQVQLGPASALRASILAAEQGAAPLAAAAAGS